MEEDRVNTKGVRAFALRRGTRYAIKDAEASKKKKKVAKTRPSR